MNQLNYRNAFTEVHTILNSLVEEDYAKIPPSVLDAISRNMNDDYFYEIDETGDISKIQMLPETKAILFNLFRDYLSTPEQKEKIIKMQREDRNKGEIIKQELYNTDIFANSKEKMMEIQQNMELVTYKQSFLQKILNFVKRFFNI
jgi:hypothetical protein